MAAIKILAELFESGGARSRACARRGIGDGYARLNESGALAAANDVMLWRCRECADIHDVHTAGAMQFHCYCPSYGGLRPLPQFDPRFVRVSPTAFAKAVLAAFVGRNDISTAEPIAGVLWEAINAERPLPRPILMARRLDDVMTFKAVEKRLQRVVGRGSGVLVTASAAPAEFAIGNLEIFEMTRVVEFGAEGFRIAAASAKTVRAAVVERPRGRPDKGLSMALDLVKTRAKAKECAWGLRAESQAISALMKKTLGAKAPRLKTVEGWIREPYWELFPERRRRRTKA